MNIIVGSLLRRRYLSFIPIITNVLGQPKQLVDVTQADDGDIQSEYIDEQIAKGSHWMMGISKEKCLRTHHQ